MIYLQLLLYSLVPIGLAFGFYFLKKTKFFNKIPYIWQQIIIGVFFGSAAVLSTRYGVRIDVEPIVIDAKQISFAFANVRDASPILAGLLFGGPAGIIAGCIGGLERAFEGGITVIACSVSTALAGLYAAAFRRFFFKGKNPKWWFAIPLAIVMEVIHFVMVFVTNINHPAEIMKIIAGLCVPMIIANAFAVFVPTIFIQYFEKEKVDEDATDGKKVRRLSSQVQLWLLLSILVCYFVSTTITYAVQTSNAYEEADSTFNLTVDDVKQDVKESSDKYISNQLNSIKKRYNQFKPEIQTKEDGHNYFVNLKQEFNVYSIDLINTAGEFVYSSYAVNVDFNMATGNPELHNKMINDTLGLPFIRDFEPNDDEGKLVKYGYLPMGDGSYLAVGLDQEGFYALVDETVSDITTYRHVLNGGYILVYNGNGEVVSVIPEGKQLGLSLNDVLKEKKNSRVKAKILGTDSFYMYDTAETYTIVVVLPYDDVLFDRDSSFMLNSFMEVIVFAVLFTLIYSLLDKSVVKKIEVINDDLNTITKGNLDTKVDVRSSKEFSSLSDDINFTVDALKGYIDAANRRIDEELKFAKSIQESVLPSTFPAFPDRKEFDIHATMHTAKQVGGDFYDFYFSNSKRFTFTIADVSGKGIPAALFMMRAKQALKSLTQTNIPINEVFEKGNNNLCEGNEAGMFVTAWSGSIDLETGILSFANGGHNPPLIKRANGKFEYLHSKPNMVLAGMDGLPYKYNELTLEPGDIVYLYTDGVTEAITKDREQFGEERLQNVLNSKDYTSCDEICDAVYKAVTEFVGDADQFDDITMLAFKYNGNK